MKLFEVCAYIVPTNKEIAPRLIIKPKLVFAASEDEAKDALAAEPTLHVDRGYGGEIVPLVRPWKREE